jgi:hypothetical protein
MPEEEASWEYPLGSWPQIVRKPEPAESAQANNYIAAHFNPFESIGRFRETGRKFTKVPLPAISDGPKSPRKDDTANCVYHYFLNLNLQIFGF